MESSIFAQARVPLRVMQREMMSGRVFLVTRKLTSYSSQCSGSTRRRHSKVDDNNLGKEVQQLIRDGQTYREIAEILQLRGICISLASIGRYAQRYLKTLNRQEVVTPSGLRLVQEVGKAVCH